jgi:hypothetical protein
MEKDIRQLVEMGATVHQARAALKKYNDVMEAAEGVFGGEFDGVADDNEDIQMASPDQGASARTTARLAVK